MLQIIHLKTGELLLPFALIVTSQQIKLFKITLVKKILIEKKIKHPINLINELSC